MLSVTFCTEYRNARLQNILVCTGEVGTCEISWLRRKRGEALPLILLPLFTNLALISHHSVCGLA